MDMKVFLFLEVFSVEYNRLAVIILHSGIDIEQRCTVGLPTEILKGDVILELSFLSHHMFTLC